MVLWHQIPESCQREGAFRGVALDRRSKQPDAQAGRARTLGCLHRLAAQCWVLTMLQAATMVLAASPQAQANACDQLKAVLAARIDVSGVRGYTMEAVPAGTPVPPDAKAIGTCESGARKILYRRWGATQASPGAANTAGPGAAPQAVVMPDEQTRRPPGVQGERTLRPVPASAPSPAPQPVARSSEAALAVPTPGHVPEKSTTGGAGEVEAVPVDPAVVQPVPLNTDATLEVKAPLARQAAAFMAANWRWIGALVLLVVVGWIWVWRAHFSAYDKAGLPRGPRL
jgi:hypothetical protein